MTPEEMGRKIIRWCTENGQYESAFLYADPEPYVSLRPLFDFIRDTLGVDTETIVQWNEEMLAEMCEEATR